MKIYFGVCGIGLGHAGRCIPIARKLQEKNAQILFSTYGDAVTYVEKEGFSLVESPSIGFMVKPDGTVDFKQTAVNPGPFLASFTLAKQVEAEIKFLKGFLPDVVVSDSRVSSLLAAKMLDIPALCILNQFQIIVPRRTRFLRLARLVDSGALAMIGKIWTGGSEQLLIPDFPPPYTLSAGNLRIPLAYQKSVNLIGPILPVQPQDLPDKEELRKKLNLEQKVPMIFVPISGPIQERAYLTEVLQKIFMNSAEDFQVVMSMGLPENSMEPIRRGKVSIYGWVSERFEYLKACDLVISRAGHGTLTQSICYGKPMILIPTPNHTEQMNNARRARELGVVEFMEQKELNDKSLKATIREMLSNDSYTKRMEEVRNNVSQRNGLQTAVESIISLFEYVTVQKINKANSSLASEAHS